MDLPMTQAPLETKSSGTPRWVMSSLSK